MMMGVRAAVVTQPFPFLRIMFHLKTGWAIPLLIDFPLFPCTPGFDWIFCTCGATCDPLVYVHNIMMTR